MGDNEGGSSGAAQRAQTPHSEKAGGFWARIFAGADRSNDLNGLQVLEQNNTTSKPVAGLGMVNLRQMRLEDVAVPKADILAVSEDIKKDDLVQVFRESGLSRIPVFRGTLDTPIGLVHLKDLALKHGFNGTGTRFNLKKMVRPLLFAPPSMPIGVLLQKMQNDRIHMALVVDEYGGVDGLVTIEDLIEQVIGEIEDEHDTAEGEFWTLEKPGCYMADAKAPLDDFEAEIGMSLDVPGNDEETETLGGLIFVLTGRIPSRGEVIPHPAGPDFEVVEADARRIKRLRVRLPQLIADD